MVKLTCHLQFLTLLLQVCKLLTRLIIKPLEGMIWKELYFLFSNLNLIQYISFACSIEFETVTQISRRITPVPNFHLNLLKDSESSENSYPTVISHFITHVGVNEIYLTSSCMLVWMKYSKTQKIKLKYDQRDGMDGSPLTSNDAATLRRQLSKRVCQVNDMHKKQSWFPLWWPANERIDCVRRSGRRRMLCASEHYGWNSTQQTAGSIHGVQGPVLETMECLVLNGF